MTIAAANIFTREDASTMEWAVDLAAVIAASPG
jgi:hypothetical protein